MDLDPLGLLTLHCKPNIVKLDLAWLNGMLQIAVSLLERVDLKA